jgi:hypothetical protein
VHGRIPDGFESYERFFLRNRISPMVEDYIIPKYAPELKKLQAEFLLPKPTSN